MANESGIIGKEFMKPKNDLIFRLVYGDKKHPEYISGFLQALLILPDDEFESAEIVSPELSRENVTDKLGILDVKVLTRLKKVIDVEVQLRPTHEFLERVLFYQGKLVTEQVSKGSGYMDIKRVINVIIADYPLIKSDERYNHRFRLYDKEACVELTDLVEIDTLELPKLPENDDGTELWRNLKFLTASDKEELKMIAEKSPLLKSAAERIIELQEDRDAREWFEARKKAEWDMQARLRGAVQQGIREQAIESAIKMLNAGVSTDNIILFTGLTREEVTKLPT